MLSPSTRAQVDPADEFLADDEGLRQAVGAGLHGICEIEAPLLAVAEQLLEPRRIGGVEITRMSRMPASISIDSG